MRCKEIESLLIEYVDEELDETRKASVAAHLSGCASCSKKEQLLRHKIVGLFKGSGYLKPSEETWLNIKEGITERQPDASSVSLVNKWLDRFRIRLPVLVPAAVSAVLIIALFTFNTSRVNQAEINLLLAEQLQFLAELGQNGYESDFGIEDVEIGTSI